MARQTIRRFIQIIFDKLSAKKAEQELAQSMGDAGKKGGENFLREARKAFDRRLADLKNLLAKGLINQAEFKKQADIAARTFNQTIIQGMEKARTAGKLTETEYLKLSRTLKRVGDDGATAWDRIKASIVRAGAALFVAFGIRGGIRFAFASIQEFLSSEKDWKSLEGTINATGVSFAGLEKRVRAAAQAFQEATVHSDEDYARSLQRLIAITGDVEGSIRNMTLVADIAARFFGGDLAAATDAVAKGMNTGVVTINRMKFTLDDLAKRSLGASAEATETLAGKLQQLNNQWGEFKEAIGEVLVGGPGAVSVLDTLTTSVQAMVKWVQENRQEIQRWVSQGLNTAIDAMRTLLNLTRTFLQLRGKLSLTAGAAAFQPGATKEAIQAQQKVLEQQRKDEQARFNRLKAQIADLRAAAEKVTGKQGAAALTAFPGLSPKMKALTEELRESGDLLQQIADNAETAKAALTDLAAPTGGGGGGGGGVGDPKAAKERAAELEKVERDIAVKTLMIQRGLTEELAREEVRREEFRRPAVERTVASLAELEAAWKRLGEVNQTIANANLLVAAGLDETLTPSLSRTESQVAQLHSVTETFANATPDLVDRFATPWINALELIHNEVEGQGTLFRDLGEAWAEGGIAGLARLAAGKVKENIAQAIEWAAKALGFFALSNPKGAAAAAGASAKHLAAAAAWKVAGAAIGGGGGDSTGGVGGGGTNLKAGETLREPQQDIHVHFVGPGFRATNPVVQEVWRGTERIVKERYGNNVRIITHKDD